MLLSKTNGSKEFRVSCLTRNGKRIEDIGDESCRRAVKQSLQLEGEHGTRPTATILAMSIERGVELLTTDWKIITNFTLTDIAFCFVSEEHPDIFAFIGRRQEDMFCNVFRCWDKKEAETIYNGMSCIFKLASEHEKHENELKQSRLRVYRDEVSFLGKKLKGKTQFSYDCEGWDEDPEAEDLMGCE